MTTGYATAREQSVAVATTLRDLATLVGEPCPTIATLESGDRVAPGLGMVNDAGHLATRAKDILQGIFKVLVMGEFKNGKSTLLNAILGETTLPAKAVPCTAVISILVHGDGRNVAVFEANRDEPRVISWDAFRAEFQLTKEDQETLERNEGLDRFEKVRFVQMERSHRFCANGVRLIDSPGLGEAASRTRVTTEFLKQSHAVVFVLNATLRR